MSIYPVSFAELCPAIIYVREDSSATLSNVEIAGNESPTAGGIGIRTRAKATILNSTVSGNKSSQGTSRGGGVYVSNGGSLTLGNSTVSGNSAVNVGAGLSIFDAGATISNSTISNNVADNIGGGIYLARSDVSLSNSIVAGNIGRLMDPDKEPYHEIFNASATFSATLITSFNVLGTDSYTNESSFTSNFMRDATDITATSDGTTPTALLGILLPLGDNNGLTQTHALPTGSPAIDAGSNAICAAEPINNFDQRGERRPEGRACDIGSYEVDAGQFFVVPLPGQKSVIFSL